VIKHGKRIQEILRFAEDLKADLIIMNSHRMDPENPAEGWGTISHKVGILSQCPVLLVK
jgi:nucleotide-binding universal stress UspA family protein